MIIHLGSDHAGLDLKDTIKGHLVQCGLTVQDHGTHTHASVDYPLLAHDVCRAVLAVPDDADSLGILVCGTGIGMSISANRHRGIRAALCTCEMHARATREHNNANVLCLGARITGEGLALELVDAFLATPFAGGRHERRVGLIENMGSSD